MTLTFTMHLSHVLDQRRRAKKQAGIWLFLGNSIKRTRRALITSVDELNDSLGNVMTLLEKINQQANMARSAIPTELVRQLSYVATPSLSSFFSLGPRPTFRRGTMNVEASILIYPTNYPLNGLAREEFLSLTTIHKIKGQLADS